MRSILIPSYEALGMVTPNYVVTESMLGDDHQGESKC